MPPDLFSDQLRTYLDDLVPPRPAEMLAMEAYAKQHSFPIIGPASGYLCYQIARMINAARVFELGSGYGYSTAWFARAVQENGGGQVHHVVWDEALSQQARRHLGVLGYDDVVTYTVSEAVEALRAAPGPFDLIFNDINKEAYPDSLPVIEEKLRPGGVLIIDNMLWSGRIFDPDDRSPATQAIRDVTQTLTRSGDWLSTLIPIRDGLILALRK